MVSQANRIAIALASLGVAAGLASGLWFHTLILRNPLPQPPKAPTPAATRAYEAQLQRADALNSGYRADRDAWLKVAAALVASAAGALAIGRFELTRADGSRADKSLDNDRFSQAVSMLATEEQTDQQLGGIYALDDLATTSHTYERTVVELLSAFVRRSEPEAPITTMDEGDLPIAVLPRRTEPVETALRLLERRSDEYSFYYRHEFEGSEPPDDWPGPFDFTGAYLAMHSFGGTVLHQARLVQATLIGARAWGLQAHGMDATLSLADGANFERCNLTFASFERARMVEVCFADADLESAKMALRPDPWV